MKKKVVVFGSFVVDLTGRTPRLPIPGETVMGSSFAMGPGGKGSNQAVAAHRAGADITLVTKVGRDVFGTVATDFYKKEGMDTSYVFEDENYIEMYDFEHSIEEDRYIAIGCVGDVLFVVFTERKENIRLISARLANEAERRLYYDQNIHY